MKYLFVMGLALAWMFANYAATEYALNEWHSSKVAILVALVVVNLALYIGIRAVQKLKAS